MNRFTLALLALIGSQTVTFAVAVAEAPAPVPGPLLGAVGGPWGLVAAAGVYGAYRWFKAKR